MRCTDATKKKIAKFVVHKIQRDSGKEAYIEGGEWNGELEETVVDCF